MVGIKITNGQRLRLETPGGGGYGSELDRDPDAVARDVVLGYVTPEGAARDYAVAVSEDGTIDVLATNEMRSEATR